MSVILDALLMADEAQRRATTPGQSAWVEANAGTGKTKVLTDRVTRLLLDGVRPERILCLTFTKAAAAEMSIRINNTLARWATLTRAGSWISASKPSLGPATRTLARVSKRFTVMRVLTWFVFVRGVTLIRLSGEATTR